MQVGRGLVALRFTLAPHCKCRCRGGGPASVGSKPECRTIEKMLDKPLNLCYDSLERTNVLSLRRSGGSLRNRDTLIKRSLLPASCHPGASYFGETCHATPYVRRSALNACFACIHASRLLVCATISIYPRFAKSLPVWRHNENGRFV